MNEKDLLALYEKLKRSYGLTRTYDEFSMSMKDEVYRKKLFDHVSGQAGSDNERKSKQQDIFGDTNYDRWNYSNFGELEKTDYTLKENVSVSDSELFSLQENKNIATPRRIRKTGTSGSGKYSGRKGVSSYTQKIIDENKRKKEEKEAKDQYFNQINRAQTGAGVLTSAIDNNKSLLEVGKAYGLKTNNKELVSKIDYYGDDIPELRKANLELDVINTVYDDYSQLYERLNNSDVFKKNVKEFEWLRGELNDRKKRISVLQEKAKNAKTKDELDLYNTQLKEILEEDSSWKVPDDLKGQKVLSYDSYQQIAERYNTLLNSSEFRQYDAVLKVANYMQDQSNTFEERNPAYVKDVEEKRKTQKTADILGEMDLPVVGGNKYFRNTIATPLLRSGLKLGKDLLTLPRTLVGLFDNDYGFLDNLADFAEEELDPANFINTTSPSKLDRGFAEQVAEVDGFQVVVNEKDNSKVENIRYQNGSLVYDEETQKNIMKKYDELYKDNNIDVTTQRNVEVLLPKTVGVLGDLATLMIGTKGLSGASKMAGKSLSKTGRVGNYLTRNLSANRIGLTGAIYGQSHNEFYNEAIENGLSQKEASAFASGASLMIAGIGQFNPQFFLLGSSKPLQKKFTKKYVGFLINDKMSTSEALKASAKFLGIQGTKETLEELAEIPGVNLVRGSFNQYLSPEKKFEIDWSRNELEETSILGFAGGFFGGTANINVSRHQKEALFRAYSDKENFKNRFKEMIGQEYPDENGEMKVITKEFVDERLEYFDKVFREIDARNQGKVVDDDIVLEMLGLQWKKQSLENTSEKTGISSVENQLKKVNEQLDEISENNTVYKEVVNEEIKPEKDPEADKEQDQEEDPNDDEISEIERVIPLEPGEKSEGSFKKGDRKEEEGTQEGDLEGRELADSEYFSNMRSKLEQANPDVEVVVSKEEAERLAKNSGANIPPGMTSRVRGVYMDGENRIVINPETFNKATAFHEFGHHWNKKVKKDRPELWSTGTALIKDSPIYKEAEDILNSRKGENQTITEDKIVDEALAMAIGKKGAELFDNVENQNKWTDWVNSVKQYFAEVFGFDTNKTLDELTLEDFTSIAAQEIATGVEVDIMQSVDMKINNKNIMAVKDKYGHVLFLNKETRKPVSKTTQRKYEKEYIRQNNFSNEQVGIARQLKDELGKDLDDRFDLLTTFFVGTGKRITRESFAEVGDINHLTGAIARSWISKDGTTLDDLAMSMEVEIYGDYKIDMVTDEQLFELILEYPSNRLPAKSELAKELEGEFLEKTGLAPTKTNIDMIVGKYDAEMEAEQNNKKEDDISDLPFDMPANISTDKIFDAIQNLKQGGKISRAKIITYFAKRFGLTRDDVRRMYDGEKMVDPVKPKERSYYGRLKESLNGSTKRTVSEEGKKYVPKSNQITDAEAQTIVDEMGIPDVMQLINENPLWLQPEVRVTLLNKVVTETENRIKELKDDGDIDGAKDMEQALANAIEKVATEGTRAGRFIQAFSILDNLNPSRFAEQFRRQIEGGKDGKSGNIKEGQKLTPEEINKIKELKKKVNDAPKGLPRANANYELYSYLDKIKFEKSTNIKKGEDLFKAFFYSSILSGFTTPIRNITANMMSIVSELYVNAVSNPSSIYQSFRGMVKGFGKGALAAKNVLTTGVKSQIGDKFDTPTTLEWFRFNTNNSIVNKILNFPLTGLIPGVAIAPNFYKFVNRVMVAGDVLFYHAGKDMRAYSLAHRMKKGDKVTKEDIEKADNILFPSEEYISTAQSQAKDEGFEEGSTQFKIRVHEILDERRDETLRNDSEDFASRVTFNYEPEGSLKILYDEVVNLRQKPLIGSVMTTFIPFARVLTNVLNRFIDWTPIGAVRAMRGGSAFNIPKLRGKKDLAPLTPEQKSHLYIKSITGMMSTLSLYALTQMGDDDDEKLVITGAGPKDYRKRLELQKAGWRPYTIKYGDKSISYIDNPLFFMIAAVGEMNDYGKYETPNEDQMQRYRDIAFGIGNSIFEQSWLQGFDDLGKTLDEPLAGFGEKLEKTLAGLTITNFHRQMIRTYQEISATPITDTKTGQYGFMNTILRDNPWFNGIIFGNGSYDDLYDEKGIPVVPQQIEKFVPFKLDFGGRKTDQITKLLTDNGVYTTRPGNRNVYDMETGKSRKMNDKEYNQYLKISGTKLGEYLKEYYSEMTEMTPLELQDFYRGVKRQANDEAYSLFLESYYK